MTCCLVLDSSSVAFDPCHHDWGIVQNVLSIIMQSAGQLLYTWYAGEPWGTMGIIIHVLGVRVKPVASIFCAKCHPERLRAQLMYDSKW